MCIKLSKYLIWGLKNNKWGVVIYKYQEGINYYKDVQNKDGVHNT